VSGGHCHAPCSQEHHQQHKAPQEGAGPAPCGIHKLSVGREEERLLRPPTHPPPWITLSSSAHQQRFSFPHPWQPQSFKLVHLMPKLGLLGPTFPLQPYSWLALYPQALFPSPSPDLLNHLAYF
jgi:hypothetical protein